MLTLGVYAKGSYLRGAVARFGTFPMEPGPQLVAGCADRTAAELLELALAVPSVVVM